MRAKTSSTEQPATRFGGLLWQRNFRLFWIGETVNQLGGSMATIGVPLLAVLFLHATTFEVGLLVAAGYLPWLVIGLPVGAWLDRLPARPVMVACDLLAGGVYASIPIAYAAGGLHIGQLIGVQLVAGVTDVAFLTAYQLFLPSLVEADELSEANAKIQGSYSAASLGGRGLSGVVTQTVGAASAVVFNAGSFLISAGCLARIRASQPRTVPTTRTSTMRQQVIEGVAFVSRDRYLRPLALFGGVANFALDGFAALVVVFLVRDLSLTAGLTGVLTALPGLGGLLAAFLLSPIVVRVGDGRGLLLATAMLPFALLAPLAEPGGRLAFYVVGILIAATGVGLINIITATFRQRYSPPGMLGRVVVTMRFVTMGTSPFGALAGGALGAWLGARVGLWVVFGILTASGGCLLTGTFIRTRDLPTSSTAAGGRPEPTCS